MLSWFAVYAVLVAGLTAIPSGLLRPGTVPTGTVATTVSVCPLITETVLSPELAT